MRLLARAFLISTLALQRTSADLIPRSAASTASSLISLIARSIGESKSLMIERCCRPSIISFSSLTNTII
ncbi:hypothetical protein AWJ14_09560 [Hoeflea olei]|uniref:Uncharacterized protein n=1 Tax=Hoeflea olei TaxID=1480615 RepID=A0A1C1Z0I6_9HYPH|nr:hypothetical protein AWJ14_09560 [Hoeflea olei]